MFSEARLEIGPVSSPSATANVSSASLNARRLVGSALLLLFALGGTVLLCAWGGVSLRESLRALVTAPLWLIAAFTALTAAQVVLSAWKWQLVLRKLGPSPSAAMPFRFLFNCTALAAFLSQFLTVYLASVVVRGWALKRSYGLTARYGATTSLFEQLFDLIIIVVMVVPTLLVWAFDGNFEQWMLATVAAIIVGVALLPLFVLAERGFGLLGRLGSKMQGLSAALHQCSGAGLLSLPFVFKFYVISLARYFTMLVRIPLLVVAFGLPFEFADTVPGFTIVQATQIAAITPGQLGIREWTWSGVLAVRGYQLQEAAYFAIDLRLVGTVAMTLVTLTCIGGFRRRSI